VRFCNRKSKECRQHRHRDQVVVNLGSLEADKFDTEDDIGSGDKSDGVRPEQLE
jgi:hypothetical protein